MLARRRRRHRRTDRVVVWGSAWRRAGVANTIGEHDRRTRSRVRMSHCGGLPRQFRERSDRCVPWLPPPARTQGRCAGGVPLAGLTCRHGRRAVLTGCLTGAWCQPDGSFGWSLACGAASVAATSRSPVLAQLRRHHRGCRVLRARQCGVAAPRRHELRHWRLPDTADRSPASPGDRRRRAAQSHPGRPLATAVAYQPVCLRCHLRGSRDRAGRGALAAAAQLVGIPADFAPRDVAGLRALLAEMPLLLTPGAARVRELVLHPPISWL